MNEVNNNTNAENGEVDESDKTWGGLFEDPGKQRRYQPYSRSSRLMRNSINSNSTNITSSSSSSSSSTLSSSSSFNFMTRSRMEYNSENVPVIVTRCGNCNHRVNPENGICNRWCVYFQF